MSDDWQNYKSGPVRKIESTFLNPGKPILNDQDEYVFILKTVNLASQIEGFKKGTKIDKFKTVWEDQKSKNILSQDFRVDSLVFNIDNPKFQSPAITFFKRIGLEMKEGTEPIWGNYFIVGMRVRSRVQPVTKDGIPTGAYRFLLDTVRKFAE